MAETALAVRDPLQRSATGGVTAAGPERTPVDRVVPPPCCHNQDVIGDDRAATRITASRKLRHRFANATALMWPRCCSLRWESRWMVCLTGNKQLNVLHRLSRTCGCQSRPASWPGDTRGEPPGRRIRLFGPRDSRAGSRFCLAFRPQKRRTFCASYNAGMLPLNRLGRRYDKITCDFQELSRIGQIVDHERRESLGSIKRDVPLMLHRSGNIHPCACNLGSRLSRCDWVATAITALPALRAAAMK